MKFFTGDESGLVKVTDIDHKVSLLEAQNKAAKKVRSDAKAKANAKSGEKVIVEDNILLGVQVKTFHGTVSRPLSIQQMIQGTYNGTAAFFVARKNGDIQAIDKTSGQTVYDYAQPMFEEKTSVKSNGRYINARSYVGLGVGDDCFVSCTNMGEVQYQNTQGSGGGRMKLPVDVVRMRSHKDRAQVFAAGGREQELSVWDAETACTAAEWVKPAVQPLFKSKNIADDGLGLRPPVWVTDMQFLDANTSVPQLAVSTGHGQIRIYDAKAQQRPVQDWQITKHPILHILASHLRPELFFADNMGNMQQLDLRTGKVIGGYKGIAGAVCDMALSEDGRKVAEVGLDRFLRVYETDGMRLLRHRAYIKQRVSQVVWDWDEKDLNQREIDQIEAEHIWETMDTLGEEQRTKKGSKRKAL